MSTTELSQALTRAARAPLYRGAIFQMEADDKGMALIEAKVNTLKIYALVDPDANQILETRFFTYGGPGFTALADQLCGRMVGKSVSELSEIATEQLEIPLRDQPDLPALAPDSPEMQSIPQLLQILQSNYPEKRMIALAARKAMESSQLRTSSAEGRAEADKEWLALDTSERLRRIQTCLDKHVRQALNMDGGDIEIIELLNDTHLRVRYQGACSSCGSSVGGTLIYIENQLRDFVHYNLTVEPETNFF